MEKEQLLALYDASETRFVKSSNLNSVRYAKAEQVLFIEFKTGTVYAYLNVPLWVMTGLIEAESKGKFFTVNIKKAAYPYVKISG